MQIGDLVSGRFLLQSEVGEGGSAKVYRALDRKDGQPVALKAFFDVEDHRFQKEARTLAELSHPNVVRYVAHGTTPAGESFIAMEWLEGETLATRLARGPLTTTESLAVIRQTADALAKPHAEGLVHRDLKPSNLFLVGANAEDLRVLDFGIAKVLRDTNLRTHTGELLGTVGYMSPEQAMAARDADARADIFALGCVLLECLTGRPAFVAGHAVALLAKVLTQPAPRLSSMRPELGGELDELVARMLAKDPAERPSNAAALLTELETVAMQLPDRTSSRPSSVPSSLTGVERRVVSVAIVELGEKSAPGEGNEALKRMQQVAARFGAEATLLSNGALLLVLSGRGAAGDRAAHAAACTLALQRMAPEVRIALSTGWVEQNAMTSVPVGPVIDRAAALLHGRNTEDGTRGVLLDTTTARLLAARFDIDDRDGAALVLLGEHAGDERPPRLLGKTTRCVGREQELAILLSVFSDCVAERAPRAVVVTADAGVGKSRLAHEFIVSAQREGVRVLKARSASTGAGSVLHLARQLIRAATRLVDSSTAEEARSALFTRLRSGIAERPARQCAAFLCEIIGVPVEAEPDSVLNAARGDARLMSDWMRRSFGEWIAVEAKEPLVIVLEDLHWGDAATVSYLGDALCRKDLPLLVLALGRRELHDVFPKLWAGTQLQEIGLAGLRRSAAGDLVRSVLPSLSPEVLGRVVERANGNAFCLEELIRAVAMDEHRLPETIAAIHQAGLDRLDPAARHLLRAASVFGERFTARAVEAIVGAAFGTAEGLRTLEQQEVIWPVRDGASTDEYYAFRHALLRDAAHATFTDADRRTAHLLAAEYLERGGPVDPVVMADHMEAAGASDRAVPWLVRAAELAYAAGSPADARRLSARGVGAATGEDRGTLELLDGASALLQGDYRAAVASLTAAKPRLVPGSDRWFLGTATLAYASTVAGDTKAAGEFIASMQSLPMLPVHNPLCAFGIARGILTLSFSGDHGRARAMIERVESESARHPKLNPSSEAWLDLARGFSFMANVCPLHESIAHAQHAVELFEEAQDKLALPSALCWLAVMKACVGNYRDSVIVQTAAIAQAESGGNLISPALMKPLLELARALNGEPQSALETLHLAGRTNPLSDSVALWVRAYVLALLGRPAEAEAACRASMAGGLAITAHVAEVTLSRLLLDRGQLAESLDHATRALGRPILDPFNLASEVRLIRAEALAGLGQVEAARAELGELRDALLATAELLAEEDKVPFLENVRYNARALKLAAEVP